MTGFTKKLSLVLVHSNLTQFHYNQWSSLNCAVNIAFSAVSEFCPTKMPLIGHCVQETIRYVCDWLHFSMLQKHIVNSNCWCSSACKHKYALDSLPDLKLWVLFCFCLLVASSSSTPVEPGLGLANCFKLHGGLHRDSPNVAPVWQNTVCKQMFIADILSCFSSPNRLIH